MSVSLFGRTVAGERVVVLARRRRMRVVQKLLPEGFIKEKKVLQERTIGAQF